MGVHREDVFEIGRWALLVISYHKSCKTCLELTWIRCFFYGPGEEAHSCPSFLSQFLMPNLFFHSAEKTISLFNSCHRTLSVISFSDRKACEYTLAARIENYENLEP